MATDLKHAETDIYSREWLRAACDDLGKEIERSHNLYPEKFSVLGFYPDYLMSGHDSLLSRWQQQLGGEPLLRFLKYLVLAQRGWPSTCFCRKNRWPTWRFLFKNLPGLQIPEKIFSSSTDAYCRSLAALSRPQSLPLLTKTVVGSAFLELPKRFAPQRLLFTRMNWLGSVMSVLHGVI